MALTMLGAHAPRVGRIEIARVYDADAQTPGRRFLVDRLWPRGVAKDDLPLDGWLKDAAPSAELRRWFGHEPARFAAFRRRYLDELAAQDAKVRELRRRARGGTLTLVYGAHDSEHNDAVVLAELLRRGRRSR